MVFGKSTLSQFRQFGPAANPQRIIGHTVHEVQETTSTNRLLTEMALDGAPHGAVVVADHQTCGSGKGDRVWFSKPGCGILTSILLRLNMPIQDLSQITLLTGVAVLDALRDAGVTNAEVKWPNDILINGRKVCGILAETCFSPSGDPDFVVVGIGLNVSQTDRDFPPNLQAIATSLAASVHHVPSRRRVFSSVLKSFETWLSRWCAEGFRPVAQAWSAQSFTLGRRVEFETPDFAGVGEAVGLGEDGCLLIREQGGTLHRFYSGEVRYADVPLFELRQMRSVS